MAEKIPSLAERMRKRFDAQQKLESSLQARKERAEFEDVKKGKTDPLEAQWEGTERNSGYTLPDSFEELGTRGALCFLALAESKRRNRKYFGQPIEKILTDKFKRKDVAEIYERSYNAANPEDGGMFIMPQYLAQEFVPLLRSLAPVFALGARRIPMTKDQAFYYGQASGATAEWVGELETSGTSQAKYNDVKLNAKKLMAKCYGSNDLLDDVSPDTLEMFRDDLIAAMAEVMTNAAILHPGSDKAPKGLLHYPIQELDLNAQLSPKTFSHGIKRIKKAKIPTRRENCGWLMGPDLEQIISTMQTTTGHFIFADEMNSGRLWRSHYEVWDAMPVTDNTSPTLDTTSLLFGDWREFMVGISKQMDVDVDDRVTIDVGGGKKLDAFDVDAFVIRCLMKLDYGVRRPEAFLNIKNIQIPAEA